MCYLHTYLRDSRPENHWMIKEMERQGKHSETQIKVINKPWHEKGETNDIRIDQHDRDPEKIR